MPNSTAPRINRISSTVCAGVLNAGDSSGARRRAAMAKPIAATGTAPPMTKARLGSHAPARSRKPITFAGLIICEIVRPSPNTSPETRAARMAGMGSNPDDVPRDKHGNDGARHEESGRGERAPRKPRDTAYAMSAGAAAAKPRSEADEESGDDDERRRRGQQDWRHRAAGEAIEERRCDEADDEGNAPRRLAGTRRPEIAGDAGDAAHAEPQQRGGKADQRSTDRGGDRREVVHGASLSR